MRHLPLLFLSLITVNSFSQNRKLDSLSSFIQHYPVDDTVKVNALNELSSEYLWTDYYLMLENADRALILSHQLNYSKGKAVANNLKGFCYWAFGDNELAIKVALEAAALTEAPGILAESYMVLSRAYFDLGEKEKAKEYVDAAEKMALQAKNWDQLAGVYNWIGVIYFVDRRQDSALHFYNKALQISEEHSVAKINFPRIISNIGECYLDRNPELAISYFKKALLLAKETGNKTAETSISGIMGHTLFKAGDYAGADNYFQESLQLSRKLKLRRVIRHTYEGLVKLRLQEGRTTEAIEYMRSYYEVRDSLLSTSKTRQIVELEAKYELETKEQAIKLLEQEKKIQMIWRNVMLSGVLLTSIAAILIYLLQRSRTRKAKQLLKVQQMLNDKLTEINKLNSRFFTNVSHEFRTPLTLILAPIEEIQKSKSLSDDEQKLLTLAKRNGNRLLDLINQLLDLAKLEAGKMNLQVRYGDMEQFLLIIASSFESLAEQKHIQFVKNISLRETHVLFDQDKLEKIITNLLANAFKFTAVNGSVSFIASGDDKALHIKVIDTGKGISETDQQHVFSPFYQSKQAESEGNRIGTGIGLSMVNELVKLYRGTISLKSKLEVGTSFTVSIPLREEEFSSAEIVDADLQLS